MAELNCKALELLRSLTPHYRHHSTCDQPLPPSPLELKGMRLTRSQEELALALHDLIPMNLRPLDCIHNFREDAVVQPFCIIRVEGNDPRRMSH